MIERRIRVLKDHILKTKYGTHFLSEGEVKRVRFRHKNKFEELTGFGFFVEADPDEKETKSIPTIPYVEEDDDIGNTTIVNDVVVVEATPQYVSNTHISSEEERVEEEKDSGEDKLALEVKIPQEEDTVESEESQNKRGSTALEYEVPIAQQDPDKPELIPIKEVEKGLSDLDVPGDVRQENEE